MKIWKNKIFSSSQKKKKKKTFIILKKGKQEFDHQLSRLIFLFVLFEEKKIYNIKKKKRNF